MLTRLASDAVLEAAYTWLCRRRQGWPADADIWSFRHRWPQEKACLKTELRAGRYRFDNLSRVTRRDGEEVEIWSSRDALVLKALALVLADHLPVSRSCTQRQGPWRCQGGGPLGLAACCRRAASCCAPT